MNSALIVHPERIICSAIEFRIITQNTNPKIIVAYDCLNKNVNIKTYSFL